MTIHSYNGISDFISKLQFLDIELNEDNNPKNLSCFVVHEYRDTLTFTGEKWTTCWSIKDLPSHIEEIANDPNVKKVLICIELHTPTFDDKYILDDMFVYVKSKKGD